MKKIIVSIVALFVVLFFSLAFLVGQVRQSFANDEDCGTPTIDTFAATWRLDDVQFTIDDKESTDDTTVYRVTFSAVNLTNRPIEGFPSDDVWLETRSGRLYQGRWGLDFTTPPRHLVYNPNLPRSVTLVYRLPKDEVPIGPASSDGTYGANFATPTS